MANRSPPMPFIMGSVTPRTAFAAIAASTAEPPRASTCAPATEACTWLVATMPYLVTTIERALERSRADMEEVRSSTAAAIRIESFMLHLPLCSENPQGEYCEHTTGILLGSRFHLGETQFFPGPTYDPPQTLRQTVPAQREQRWRPVGRRRPAGPQTFREWPSLR